MHSDVPQTGSFSTSNSMLNAVHHLTRYASMSNLMDVPTGEHSHLHSHTAPGDEDEGLM